MGSVKVFTRALARGRFRGAQVTKREVRRRIVSWQTQGARRGAESLSWILVRGARVGPVAYLNAVHPCRHVGAVGRERHVEPREVVCVDFAGILTSIEAAGAAVDRLRAIAVFEAVLNLAL